MSITLGCAAYISGDLSGSAMGISTITGIDSQIIGPIIGCIVLFIVYKGSFKILERLLTALVVVMVVVFVTTMFVAKPDLGEVARGFKRDEL
nr:divalent metal cation transporter [Intestinibacter sp.]